MMKNYTVEKCSNGFALRETKTDQDVFVVRNQEMAKAICRSLNAGAAFDGWTPTFMLREGTFFIDDRLVGTKR